jgi:non-specific serine/threonine protein kinase
MNDIFITPHLKLRETEGSRFDEGNGPGLLSLLKSAPAHETPSPSIAYFRRFARDCAARLCAAGDADSRSLAETFQTIRPSLGELAFKVLEAPPLTGGEYLTADFLLSLLLDLEAAIEAACAAAGGSPTEFLRSLGPNWKDVGKISFHLAENKNDPDGAHPFAFMASFVHRLGEGDRPRHLPLAAALKTHADNRPALNALLAPIQKAAESSDLVRQLWETRAIFKPAAWSAAQAYRFLQDIPAFEAANILVRIANLWKASPPKAAVTVALETNNKNRLGTSALLDYSVSVSIGGDTLTESEIQELLQSAGGLVRIRGQWVVADPAKIAAVLAQWKDAQQLARAEGISMAKGLRLLAGADTGFAGGGDDADAGDAIRFEPGPELQRMLADLLAPGDIALPDLPDPLRATLRHYQLDGVKYLWRTTALGMGPCLADDMGLGKTLQILSLVTLWKRAGLLADLPALLVLPATLLANWRAESARFTPDLKLATLHPSVLGKADMDAMARDPKAFLAGHDIALITYGMVVRTPALAEIEFPAVIVDEAQAIKNPNSRQSRGVRHLRGSRRIALTGTPVENRLSDLWCLFDFTNPGLLGSAKAFAEFQKTLAGEDGSRNYAPLRRLTRPFILRRLKSDKSIIADLPDKTEMQAWCNLSKAQAALYEKAVDSLERDLQTMDGIQRRGIILAYLMQFKQICNHPAQYTGNGDFDPAASGKFDRLAELVEPIAARQEKLLVFTQFREMTDPLHDHLARCFGRPGLILHGGTPVKKRAGLVADFQADDGPPFFVLSLKAAGTGLNLTAASHVVHFDRWWNPAVENQASDRAYRIGQKRNVLIHKFVCRGTLEEKIDALIADKQHLADALLGDGTEKLLTEMSNDELIRFVKLDLATLET